MNLDDNIVRYLLSFSIKFPEKTAFTTLDSSLQEKDKISYSELASRVEQLSTRNNFKKHSQKCAVLFYNSVNDFVIAFLACQNLGIIPIPVPFSKGGKQFKRISNILSDSSATVIFCSIASEKYLKSSLLDYPDLTSVEVVSTNEFSDSAVLKLNLNTTDQKISFIQYTSGSTNSPKGVIVSKGNLIHNQGLLKEAFKCDEESRIFSWLPFHHDMGLVGNILHTIYTGCTCIVMSSFHFVQKPQSWLEAISKFNITHSGGPNFSYDMCVDKTSGEVFKRLDLSSWKVAYNGSEQVRSETLSRFSNHFKEAGFKEDAFYPCYGLAECTLLVSGAKEREKSLVVHIDKKSLSADQIVLAPQDVEDSYSIVSNGKIINGSTVKIIGLSGQRECHDLQQGEICIAGRSVTDGYWNKSTDHLFYEINNEKFLRSGDIGFFYQDQLFICGRYKEVLIIRGRNLYPYDIEEAISLNHEAINRNGVVAFSVNDNLIVIVEIKRTYLHKNIFNEVLVGVNSLVTSSFNIAPYDIVLTIESGIPRTTSGKLQRVKCQSDYNFQKIRILASKLHVLPDGLSLDEFSAYKEQVLLLKDSDSIKKYLLDLIHRKVGISSVNHISENTELTGIGIDSIKLMEIINHINTDLDIHLDAPMIFEDNTIHAITGLIEGLLWLRNEPIAGKEVIL